MYYSDDSDVEIRSLSDESEEFNSDESMRSESPAPSDDESIYSYSSSVNGQRLRDYNGRMFNTIHEVYIMPSDEEEHTRHDIQHRCLSHAIGSLYASPERVRSALAPNPNYTPAIIDIGTGAGSWATEMALEFPHAEVLGIDLAPPTLGPINIPDNCRFEVDDCNLPLTHYMNSFNVAHIRSVEFGLDDYEAVINEVALILRHGGILLLAAGDLRLYNHDRKPLPDVEEGEEGFTWCQRIFTAILDASKNRGCKSWNARALWHGWLEKNPNYEDIQTFDVIIPIGAWQKGPSVNERITFISELMRLDLLRLFKSCKPMLVGDGYPASMVDRWLANVEIEFQKLEVKAFAKWRYTSARRRSTPFVTN